MNTNTDASMPVLGELSATMQMAIKAAGEKRNKRQEFYIGVTASVDSRMFSLADVQEKQEYFLATGQEDFTLLKMERFFRGRPTREVSLTSARILKSIRGADIELSDLAQYGFFTKDCADAVYATGSCRDILDFTTCVQGTDWTRCAKHLGKYGNSNVRFQFADSCDDPSVLRAMILFYSEREEKKERT